ncbi:MAG: hypothetical protein QM804_11870 [Propionicimonas sp.]
MTGLRARATAPVTPSFEREDLAGLAALLEVDLLEVGLRGRVDQAERPAAAAQQFNRAAQDLLQQGLQPELAGEILRDRGQGVRPGTLAGRRLIDVVHALAPTLGSDDPTLAGRRWPWPPGLAIPEPDEGSCPYPGSNSPSDSST